MKIVKIFINQAQNAAHAPEYLMPFAHGLTLFSFSVSSVSIVITVLLDDW